MKKEQKRIIAFVLCLILSLANIQLVQAAERMQDTTGELSTSVSAGNMRASVSSGEPFTSGPIKPTEADIQIIPDKYNTGCKGTLTALQMDTENTMMVNGVTIIPASNGTRFVLDFGYRNKDISGTVYIENYDFSSNGFWCYHEDLADRDIKVVFNNCKFKGVNTGKGDGDISYEFNNCTITNFSGSNCTFNRCQFGHSYTDGVVPFVDIELNDCFFSDMAGMVTDKGVHTDGTQIYGIADIDVNNVSYNNCRFEVPALHAEGSAAYVNACIMLGLEYSSAQDLTFKDIIVNGGGYSIYAGSKFEQYTFENTSFDGIRFGDASKYGIFYSGIDPTIPITNVSAVGSLYVGSVWKADGQTHFSVTNDTSQERNLVIYTDTGIYEYTIPACYKSSQFTTDLKYEDFPFDMDIVVPADCQYAVCYDNTISGVGQQIRFVNWSDSDVYLTEEANELLFSGDANEVLLSGTCGKDITYTLTKTGVLTLSGTGATYDYHSGKQPEWVEYQGIIKKIVVEEGITKLGNQIFRACTSVEEIILPDSLTTLGGRSLQGCVSVGEITLPANIQTIGTHAFTGTVLSEVNYEGSNWDAVNVESGNDKLLIKLGVDVPESDDEIIDDGSGDDGSSDDEIIDDGSDEDESVDDGSDEDESVDGGSDGDESADSGSGTGESTESGSSTSESAKNESSTSGSTKNESGTSESAKKESNTSENTKSESGASESSKSESNTSESAQSGNSVGASTESGNSKTDNKVEATDESVSNEDTPDTEVGQDEIKTDETTQTESESLEATTENVETEKESNGSKIIFIILGIVLLAGAGVVAIKYITTKKS